MGEVTLVIDGGEFRGWTSARVSRSLEKVASEFELELTDRWEGQTELRPLRPHVSCEIFLDGCPVLVGVIDGVTPSYDATNHTVRVVGRSLTGQLVDCSAEVTAGELKGLTLAAIAEKLAEPHGVEVVDLAGADEPFPRVVVEPGETAFETLQRLADQRGVFLTDDAAGRLVIRRRSTEIQGCVEKGVNVLKCNGDLDGAEQFSNYIVRGQREGADKLSPDASARVVGRAVDASVPIHRPLVVLSDQQGDAARLLERAEFEAARRRGRARRWLYLLNGWRRPDDALWVVAEEVHVTDDFMGFDGTRLLVIEASWTKDDRGELVEIEVAPPEGFDLIAEKPVVEGEAKLVGWDEL